MTPDGEQLEIDWTAPPIDGDTYVPPLDGVRLGKQHQAIFNLMRDGTWRTLQWIEEDTGYPQASISARLRDFRKVRFGGHLVQRRRHPDYKGLWQYRLLMDGNPPELRRDSVR